MFFIFVCVCSGLFVCVLYVKVCVSYCKWFLNFWRYVKIFVSGGDIDLDVFLLLDIDGDLESL